MSTTPTATGATDALGVEIYRGDTVRVASWGHPVRLADVNRTATAIGTTRHGGVVLARVDGDTDPIARGRAVSPGMLIVARRDGLPGHEGNRPDRITETDPSADRCYDCGAVHPRWFAEYLTRLWESEDGSVTPELDARARDFSETEHAGCFL